MSNVFPCILTNFKNVFAGILTNLRNVFTGILTKIKKDAVFRGASFSLFFLDYSFIVK